jgi:hypothetical protein
MVTRARDCPEGTAPISEKMFEMADCGITQGGNLKIGRYPKSRICHRVRSKRSKLASKCLKG